MSVYRGSRRRTRALLLASISGLVAWTSPAWAERAIRMAVAPFEGEVASEPVAEMLSQRLDRMGIARLVGPERSGAVGVFDPQAEQVRGWASRAEVDSVVVGRVVEGDARNGKRQIEAAVRSGHSGAELFRHRMIVSERAALGSVLDELASLIVRDLGGDPLAAIDLRKLPTTPPVSAAGRERRARSESAEPAGPAKRVEPAEPIAEPEKEAPRAAATKPSGGASTMGKVETRIGVVAFDPEAPIEIKANQAEIMAEGENRRLIFQGGVWVKQDNVTLTSEWLEAEYLNGASEPDRLLARGKVHVVQINRAARCDRAEYKRSTQMMTCRGHAELIQGCDVVRGELIVLELAADRARVEGAASIVISPKRAADTKCAKPISRPAPGGKS